MRKFTSALCTAVAMSFALLSYSPAEAAPVFVPNGGADSGVIQAQTRAQIEEMQQPGYRQFRRDRRSYRQPQVYHNDFYQQGGYYYYRGHRGYREPRPGYRHYNGFWFPAGAFIAGAIIGGAINSGPAYYNGGNAHVRWCYNRYRSYRAYDNTFQPYHGPRQQCYSPYS
ncbi:MAG: BA14K family protein [Mesorhizobium sp.]|nr:BA14K family protein [Mesorhizobium sp.]